MKVELTPLTDPERVEGKKGERFVALCLSGDDVVVAVVKSSDLLHKGKPFVLDGFYSPAQRPGDKPHLYVR